MRLLHPRTEELIFRLRAEGLSLPAIAKRTHRTPQTIWCILRISQKRRAKLRKTARKATK